MRLDLTPPVSNIIALNPACASALEIQKKKTDDHRKCIGRHKRVTVDSETRSIVCDDCGFVVDAFDYVEQWAIEGERRMEELNSIEVRRKIASAEHQALEKKLNSIRAKLKKEGQPQTHDERYQFNRLRWNPRLATDEEIAKLSPTP